MLLFLGEQLTSGTHLLLGVLEETFGQRRNAVVNIFESEHVTWPTRQGFNFCASVL